MHSRWALARATVALPYERTVAGQVRGVSTRLRIFFVGLCLLSMTSVLAAGFPSAPAETQQPVRWTLSASRRDGSRVSKATTVVAHLRATMQPGWHIYALDQGPGGPVPMRISLPRHVFLMDGDIDSPTPKAAFDPNFGIEVRYYEGEAAFTLHLRSGSQIPSERFNVFVDVLYQACTQQMCLPPEVVHLSAGVSG
jgi:DsbC/DsbD-like thiol-disulfide interchange protein